jgi:hypothetical protein
LHQLSAQLDEILHLNQHGFRKRLSCVTQLITVFHDLAANVDNGKETHAVALDLSKAFDVVPHHLLIQKLISYNISPVQVNWINAFLSNRYQCVVLDGLISGPIPVTSGVPLLFLGPVLFLLFINDMVDVVKHSSVKLYADDTLLYKPITSAQDCYLLQRDLEAVHLWSVKNLMKFNASKSFVTIFSSNRNRCFQTG